jgi:hypothetical protein
MAFVMYSEAEPTLGAHTHAHAHGFYGGHGCEIIVRGIGFVHPCIQFQNGVKLLGCREYTNQEAHRAEARDSERLYLSDPTETWCRRVIHITQFLNTRTQFE